MSTRVVAQSSRECRGVTLLPKRHRGGAGPRAATVEPPGGGTGGSPVYGLSWSGRRDGGARPNRRRGGRCTGRSGSIRRAPRAGVRGRSGMLSMSSHRRATPPPPPSLTVQRSSRRRPRRAGRARRSPGPAIAPNGRHSPTLDGAPGAGVDPSSGRVGGDDRRRHWTRADHHDVREPPHKGTVGANGQGRAASPGHQSGNASGPRSCDSRASPEASSAGSHEYG